MQRPQFDSTAIPPLSVSAFFVSIQPSYKLKTQKPCQKDNPDDIIGIISKTYLQIHRRHTHTSALSLLSVNDLIFLHVTGVKAFEHATMM